jgi:asparagine synthase (glutamine-hydrolysing)
MCGIAGLVVPPGRAADRAVVERMCQVILHRGPDEDGFLFDANVGLGMRRLSIIDLSTGKQPLHNETQTIWAMLNGEIYNYRELRADLEKRGHRFYTHSDTETIVHLYEEYGERFVEHLNGMFAIAVWDAPRKRLLLARDRIGEKQLYLCWKNGTLAYGSEIKCVLESGLVSRDLNPHALDSYLRLLYVQAPLTMFRDVQEMPPATIAIIENGQAPRLERYWTLKFDASLRLPGPELIEVVRQQVEKSVSSRLVADVPLGALLSGGIDSSAVVAAMVRTSPHRVRTFTIGYGAEGRVYDERDEAKMLADRLGTEHQEFIIEPDIVDLVPKLVAAFDQPFADSSAVANYYVFQQTRKHVKVVLSGLGGDEVFGGYERYAALRLHERVAALPQWLRASVLPRLAALLPEPRDGGRTVDRIKRFARAAALPPAEAYRAMLTSYSVEQRRELYSPALAGALRPDVEAGEFAQLFAAAGDHDPLNQALYVDTMNYLPGDLLALTDRMSMQHSIEARAPLIDPDLVALLARVPADAKLPGGQKKYLLREAVRPWLPAEVFTRKKRGFTIPLTVWLRGELQPWLRETLSRERIERTGLFRWEGVQKIIEEHVARKQNHHARLWALLMFMNWHEQYGIARA